MISDGSDEDSDGGGGGGNNGGNIAAAAAPRQVQAVVSADHPLVAAGLLVPGQQSPAGPPCLDRRCSLLAPCGRRSRPSAVDLVSLLFNPPWVLSTSPPPSPPNSDSYSWVLDLSNHPAEAIEASSRSWPTVLTSPTFLMPRPDDGGAGGAVAGTTTVWCVGGRSVFHCMHQALHECACMRRRLYSLAFGV
jgi:hypothetical protein